jgi:hypothetical protein
MKTIAFIVIVIAIAFAASVLALVINESKDYTGDVNSGKTFEK